MERSTHGRRRGIGLMGALAMSLCAALVAAGPATAKVAEYSGQSPNASPDRDSVYLSFKVKSKKNKQTKKFNPVVVKKLDATIYINSGGCELKTGVIYREEIRVSGRTFTLTESDDTSTFTFSGRIPRNGPPKGTIRITYSASDPNVPGCDSGTLSWTAKRLPEGTL